MEVINRYRSNDGLYEFDTEEECIDYEMNQDLQEDETYILSNLVFFKGDKLSWHIMDAITSNLEGFSKTSLRGLVYAFNNYDYLYVRNGKVFAIAQRQRKRSTLAELVALFGEEHDIPKEGEDEIFLKTNGQWLSGK